LLAATALPAPAVSQGSPPSAEIVSGQELIYRGRYGAAHLYFTTMMVEHPSEPAGPALAASALIWWGEARDDETWLADSIDVLLTRAVERARTRADGAVTGAQRAEALFWLGTALGYRARQAELRGGLWRAARDAKAMYEALTEAVELDSTCVDCLLGLGVYEYALARASALARFVARLVGLGGGDAERALAWMRRASEEGAFARTEARWVYANALLREGARDMSLHEEGRRLLADLATQFPENAAFQRAAAPAAAGERR
jgi:hypothetical protein